MPSIWPCTFNQTRLAMGDGCVSSSLSGLRTMTSQVQILPLRRSATLTNMPSPPVSSAGSSDGQQKALKRGRASKPKVKTGCITCKIRRIKCDETKPACCKCSNTGRKCDGYQPPPAQPRVAVTSDSTLPEPVSGLPLYPIRASSSEIWALEYFCTKTAPKLGMHFDVDFWNRFVIPASFAEPALRHAMVAVGIFAQQRELPDKDRCFPTSSQNTIGHHAVRSMPTGRRRVDGSDIVALSNYNKSIHLLTKLVASSVKTKDIVLLACILFICIELLRGDDMAALQHFQGGMTILASPMIAKEAPVHSELMLDRVRSSILPVFNRLEMLSALFGNNASWPYSVTLPDCIPQSFSSISQARDSMVHLMNLSLRFIQDIQNIQSLGYDPHAIPASAYDEQAALLSHLQLWRSQFLSYQADHVHTMSSDDFYVVNVLEIQRIVAHTWLSTATTPFQCAHDAHIPAYTAAVCLAEQLCSFASTRTRRTETANTFLLDVEIVGPLYWVSVKCRDPAVRRRAIAIQRSLYRREGLWDSDVAAAIAERIVAIEETDLDIGSLPSEEARIHGLPFASEAEIGPLRCSVTMYTKPNGVQYGDWLSWQEQIPLDR